MVTYNGLVFCQEFIILSQLIVQEFTVRWITYYLNILIVFSKVSENLFK